MFRYALTASIFLVAFLTHAKTPGDVYEQAAKSTVVVHNIDSRGKPKSMGSGVVLPDRDVVTNCHVVKGASALKVRIGTKEYPATLRYSDWDRDVCSLTVPGISAPAVVVGNTKTLKVGAKVYAIGAPKGLELTLSDGIVSSLREVEGGRYIQTTAAISPGSSGGGLFDENGALVGLTTFYLAEGQNLNFAVPVEWVKELAKRSVKTASDAQTETHWLNKSIELENRKEWLALLDHCRSWTLAFPRSDIAWQGLAIAYGNAGQPVKAIEAIEHALSINPENASGWYSLGFAYWRTKQYAQAIESLQRSLRLNSEAANTWAFLGINYEEVNQHTKALEAYQQSLRFDPDDFKVWQRLGSAFLRTGQHAKAIESYQQAIRLNPEDVSSLFFLGMVYDATGQPAKGIETLHNALRVNPEYSEAWHYLGVIYWKAKQSAKAIESFQQAVRINPEYISAWYNLGANYKAAGQREQVMNVYAKLKLLSPKRADEFFTKYVLP